MNITIENNKGCHCEESRLKRDDVAISWICEEIATLCSQ